MENEKNNESYRVGLPRNIILDYLKQTENEWKCTETPPNGKNKIRTIKFTRKEKESYNET
jgi:hypothetical protein